MDALKWIAGALPLLISVYMLMTMLVLRKDSKFHADTVLPKLYFPLAALIIKDLIIAILIFSQSPDSFRAIRELKVPELAAVNPQWAYTIVFLEFAATTVLLRALMELIDASKKERGSFLTIAIIAFGVMLGAAIFKFLPPVIIIFGALVATALLTMWFIITLSQVYIGKGEMLIINNRTVVSLGLVVMVIGFFFFKRPMIQAIIELIFYGALVSLVVRRVRDNVNILLTQMERLTEEKAIILTLLQDIGAEITHNPKLDEVLQMIISYLVKVTDARAGAILLVDKNKKMLIPKTVEGFYPPVTPTEGYIASKEKFLVNKFMNEKINFGESYLGKVAETRQPILIKEALNDDRIIQSAKGILEIYTVIAVPLMMQNDLLGIVGLINKKEGGSYSEGDFNLTISIADQATVMINNIRLYNEMIEKQRAERDVEIAGEIQRNLLPQEYPQDENIQLFAYNHPAKGVGGDYYDMISFDHGRIGIVIADVAGKGVPASLVMVMIRSVVKTVARYDAEAKDIINSVNANITGEITQERYATMFYFVYDSYSGLLNYSNAAHGPMLVYRASTAEFELLDTPGMPVGIVKEFQYDQDSTILNGGDIAMLYTDGITEAMNTNREQFSLDRLKLLIQSNAHLTADELGKLIIDRIQQFVGEAPQHDDQTLLLMKVVSAEELDLSGEMTEEMALSTAEENEPAPQQQSVQQAMESGGIPPENFSLGKDIEDDPDPEGDSLY